MSRWFCGALALVFLGCGGKDTPTAGQAGAEPAPTTAPTVPSGQVGTPPTPAPEEADAPADTPAVAKPEAASPPPAAATDTWACPADARLTVDLAAATASFKALTWEHLGEWPDEKGAPTLADAPDYGPLLKQLGMAAIAPQVALRKDDVQPYEIFDCKLTVTPAQLSAGRAKDALVRVDCETPGSPEDSMEEGRVVSQMNVLRPRNEGGYCVIGTLTYDGYTSERPCLFPAPEDAHTMSLSLVHLVSADQQAIREDFYGGSCGAGTERGDDVKARFYGVEEHRLVQYLSLPIAYADYEGACPPERTTSGKATVTGDGWPRVIEHSETTDCEEGSEDDDFCDYVGDCKPGTKVETHTYGGGIYALSGKDAAGFTADARAALKAERPYEAAKFFRAAVRLAPDDAGLRGELGWALFHAYDTKGATRHTEAALAKATDPKRQGALHYNLGRIAERANDTDAAVKHYERSLELRPNDVVAKRLAKLKKDSAQRQ